jgi:formate dehydrogenase (NADP+) beta subunit
VHIGIDWLEAVHFGHVTAIGEAGADHRRGQHGDGLLPHRDAPRGRDVKVMARRSRAHFKASPWELEDAEEERVEIVENHAPRRFVVEDGRLAGDGVRPGGVVRRGRAAEEPRAGDGQIPCDEVILAIGQEAAFPWIERDIGIEFGEWDMPVVDKTTFQSTLPGVFFGGDAAWGPENIIWAVEHGHQAAISIDRTAGARRSPSAHRG